MIDNRFKTMNSKTKFSDQVDFRTPPYLFNYIKSLYGRVDYDGACFADGSNALATPLRLENEWPDGIIYSNPPFDDDSIILNASAAHIQAGYVRSKIPYHRWRRVHRQQFHPLSAENSRSH